MHNLVHASHSIQQEEACCFTRGLLQCVPALLVNPEAPADELISILTCPIPCRRFCMLVLTTVLGIGRLDDTIFTYFSVRGHIKQHCCAPFLHHWRCILQSQSRYP